LVFFFFAFSHQDAMLHGHVQAHSKKKLSWMKRAIVTHARGMNERRTERGDNLTAN
jgi:hypothetical protein